MRGCVRLDAAARGRLSVAKPRRGFHFRGIPTTCDPFDLQRVREGIAFLPWKVSSQYGPGGKTGSCEPHRAAVLPFMNRPGKTLRKAGFPSGQ